AYNLLRCGGIDIAHSRSEECHRRCLPRSRSFRVHHFRGLDSLREKANPSIDLAQPPLAVLIIGVFTAIAVARSPRHHLRHGRAFPGEQKPVLIFEALQAAWCYVVASWRRRLVALRFSCKPFSHGHPGRKPSLTNQTITPRKTNGKSHDSAPSILAATLAHSP